MKTSMGWRILGYWLVNCIGLFSCGLVSATSVGSAFTYQGRLQDGANAANGRYDFSFRLMDAPTSGNQVGAPITVTNQMVSNGLFTATIDFGPFNGTACWLEINVRSNGLATFVLLSPRQAVTPAPLGLYAVQAGSAAAVSPNAVTTASLQDGVVTANKIAAGQATKSINGLKDNVILATAGNLVLATNGNSLLLTSTGWSLTGNSGTSADKNFLGTTDPQPLNLMVNNELGLRIEPPPFGQSPNLIGGYSAAADGLYGVTIGGGGETNLANYASSIFTVVGGGRGNLIYDGSYDATLGGGYQNLIDAAAPSGVIGGGEYNLIASNSPNATIAGGSMGTIGLDSEAAVIGGGAQNWLEDENVDSLIAGGWQNHIGWGAAGSAVLGGEQNLIWDFSYNATISGGLRNTNQGAFSVISGGATNRVGGGTQYAVIGGGTQNTVATNGVYSTIAGGGFNEIHDVYGGTIAGGTWNYLDNLADYSTVGGGADNYVWPNASYSTIPGGSEAAARDYGQLAYASGYTTDYGDAQTSLYVLRRTTTNAVTSELFLDGSSQRISVPANGATSFQVMIVARNASGNVTCFDAKGGVKNLGGGLSFVGGAASVTSTVVASEITGITAPQLRTDSASGTLVLRVTGVAGQVIRWVARVQTVEVGF